MNRRDFITLSATAGAAAALPSCPSSAQTKAVFKASDVQPAGYPTVAATESLGKKLETATNGRLSVQMFPSPSSAARRKPSSRPRSARSSCLRVSAGALGPDRRRHQRRQHAVPVQEHGACREDDGRRDRPGPARQDHGERQRQSGRAVLDECRRAQHLQHQEAGEVDRRPQGHEDSASSAIRSSST